MKLKFLLTGLWVLLSFSAPSNAGSLCGPFETELDHIGCYRLTEAIQNEDLEQLKNLVQICKTAYKANECPLITSIRRRVLAPTYWRHCDYPADAYEKGCNYKDHSQSQADIEEPYYPAPIPDYLSRAIYKKNTTIIRYLLEEGASGTSDLHIGEYDIPGNNNYIGHLIWQNNTLRKLFSAYCKDGFCFSDENIKKEFLSVFSLFYNFNKKAITGPLSVNEKQINETFEGVIQGVFDAPPSFIKQLEQSGFNLFKESAYRKVGPYYPIYSLLESAVYYRNFHLFDYLVKKGLPLEQPLHNSNIFSVLGALQIVDHFGNHKTEKYNFDELAKFFSRIPQLDDLKKSKISAFSFRSALFNHQWFLASHMFKYGVRSLSFKNDSGDIMAPSSEEILIAPVSTMADSSYSWEHDCRGSNLEVAPLISFAFDRKLLNDEVCASLYIKALKFIDYILANGYRPTPNEIASLRIYLNRASSETDPRFVNLYKKLNQYIDPNSNH